MKCCAQNSFVGCAAHRGFTLIEVLVTVLVLAILTTVAIPSFRSFVVSQRVKTASFDLMSSLLMARSEAIKRNTSVNITPNSASWANGWNVATGTTTLQHQDALGNGLSVTCYAGTAAASCATVTFGGRGRLPPGTSILSIQVRANDPSTAADFATRCITIDLSGRPSSKKATCV